MAYKLCCGACDSSRVQIIETTHGGPFFNVLLCLRCHAAGPSNGLTIHYWNVKPTKDTRALAQQDLRELETRGEATIKLRRS
jgi:hypothetical protein